MTNKILGTRIDNSKKNSTFEKIDNILMIYKLQINIFFHKEKTENEIRVQGVIFLKTSSFEISKKSNLKISLKKSG